MFCIDVKTGEVIATNQQGIYHHGIRTQGVKENRVSRQYAHVGFTSITTTMLSDAEMVSCSNNRTMTITINTIRHAQDCLASVE